MTNCLKLRRVLEIVVGIAVLMALIWFAVPVQSGIISDGSYELTIQVRSTSGGQIKAVTCQAFESLGWAQDNCEYLAVPQSGDVHWITASPFPGKDLKLQIPFSEFIVTPMIGGPYLMRDSQFGGLLVIVEMDDGKKVGRAVAIPHRSVARSVIVELP